MINSNAAKIKTYVGSDGKLHFIDSAGADTALNFSSGETIKPDYYTSNKAGLAEIPADGYLYFKSVSNLHVLINIEGMGYTSLIYSGMHTLSFITTDGNLVYNSSNSTTVNMPENTKYIIAIRYSGSTTNTYITLNK